MAFPGLPRSEKDAGSNLAKFLRNVMRPQVGGLENYGSHGIGGGARGQG